MPALRELLMTPIPGSAAAVIISVMFLSAMVSFWSGYAIATWFQKRRS